MFEQATNIFDTISRLIGEKKYSDAINLLQDYIETNTDDTKAKTLLEQIKLIIKYENRDIYSNTNLDMDPWLDM